ncbi:MAG TPA: PQQ-dependent sugar dehydrogenase [Chitinophagaceae bacterium]
MKKPHFLRNLFFYLLLLFSNSLFAQPPNNACASATNQAVVGACGATGGQSLFQATAAGSPTSPYGTTYDVWYRFTAGAGITSVQIALSGTGGGISNTNTFIEAYNSASCAGISTATSIGIGTRQSGLTIADITPGVQYYFRVFTNVNPTTGGAGNWAFSICISNPGAPGNNDCAGSTLLTVGTTNTTGRVTNATASGGIPVGCATGTPDDDVWYRFTTSTAGDYIVTVNPNPNSGASSSTLGASGAMLQLFSGTCGTLASMTCGARGSLFASGLAATTTYYIRVYSFGAFGSPTAAPSNSGAGFNILVSRPTSTTVGSGRLNEIYRQTILSNPSILNDPWEITYGSDGYLWITESKGYRLLRMDPNTGARTTVLDLGWNSNFFSAPADRAFNINYELAITNPQGGFAGMALHPLFLDATTPQNYVYVSYVHSYGGGSSPNGTFFTNRLVRFTYNTGTGRLESPVSLCDTLPGSNDHNSQRMIIAPVGGTDYLFYAEGDMGAGQFGNRLRPQKSQNPNSYEGKVLRFNLVSDGDAGLNAWIPNDNPYSANSAVWAIGIRNNQGFAYDNVTGKLYGSSHGPYSDDEINIIDSLKNYGHPIVIGYAADDNYNGSTAGAALTDNGGVSSCPMITDESANAVAIGSRYRDPLFSAYDQSEATIDNIWQTNPGNGGWPSEGWSGLDIYKHTLVPGWKNSLVAASLKWGRLVRMKMDVTGTTIVPIDGSVDTSSYFGSTNRYRDIAIAPNGKDIYVIMDRSTTSSGPSAGNPVVPACPGCLQRYTFLGYNDVSSKSAIPTSIPVTDGSTNFVCNAGTTITIDNTNNNIWVPITGSDGNIMAEIHANGNNLGTVTSSYYIHSGPTRIRNGNRYLNRNITITPQNQPGSAVRIRLYFSKAEYDALDADVMSGVNAISDVKILKNDDVCGAAVASNTTLINPTFAEVFGATNGYVLQGSITSFSSFYFGSTNITLPLDLLTFRGSLQSNGALLDWETANETNTSHFIVERSIDNRNFAAIGNVTANGNTTTTTRYSYLDNDAANQPAAVIYYRIKMVDTDGSYIYSNTITISLADMAGKVSLYPNPAAQEVKLSVASVTEGKAQWKITDNSGRVVMQSSMTLRKGNNNVMININKLAGGIYYLNITGAGIDQNIKLQKL